MHLHADREKKNLENKVIPLLAGSVGFLAIDKSGLGESGLLAVRHDHSLARLLSWKF